MWLCHIFCLCHYFTPCQSFQNAQTLGQFFDPLYDQDGSELNSEYRPKPKPFVHKLVAYVKHFSFEKPAPTAAHVHLPKLSPSIEVSRLIESVYIGMQQLLPVRHTWYWAPDYICWEQFHLPWLSGFWSWWKGRDGGSVEIYWEVVQCSQTKRSAPCNLVSLSWVIL